MRQEGRTGMRRRNILRSTDVPAACIVERGEAFLPDVDMADIESLHADGTDYKVKCVLQAVRLRKQRSSFRQISKALGVAKSTVYGWLLRLAVGGIERMHDRKSPGRPCRLSVKQKKQAEEGSWQKSCRMRFSARLVDCKDSHLSYQKQVQSGVRCKWCVTADKKDWFLCQICKTRAVQLCHA